jgi:hypothetical protein
MRNSLRFSLGTVLVVVSAACSGSPDKATVSTDLEQDLAKAGGANVQLAGSSGNRVDIVSASERVESPTPAPKAPTVTRAPSARRGARAAAQPAPKAPEQAPAEQPQVQRQPDPEPVPQTRPQAPVPSRQPEPRGGWKTPGEVIRNAPFPINP